MPQAEGKGRLCPQPSPQCQPLCHGGRPARSQAPEPKPREASRLCALFTWTIGICVSDRVLLTYLLCMLNLNQRGQRLTNQQVPDMRARGGMGCRAGREINCWQDEEVKKKKYNGSNLYLADYV